jgi:hypothetical protein
MESVSWIVMTLESVIVNPSRYLSETRMGSSYVMTSKGVRDKGSRS